MVKQPHTEGDIQHTDGEQNTGNHRKPVAGGGASPGGTRTGADLHEPASGAGAAERPDEPAADA